MRRQLLCGKYIKTGLKMNKNVHYSLLDYGINIWFSKYRPKNTIKEFKR